MTCPINGHLWYNKIITTTKIIMTTITGFGAVTWGYVICTKGMVVVVIVIVVIVIMIIIILMMERKQRQQHH